MEVKERLLQIGMLFILLIHSPQGMGSIEDDSNPMPPAIGNFALPSSQQIGPLISFGQHILDKGTFQFSFFLTDIVGADMYEVEATPAMIYAFTDSFTVSLGLPFDLRNQVANQHSSGIEDTSLQLEYQFYSHGTSRFVQAATIVANVSIPTGSSEKNPPTGLGSTSYFLGTTYARMSVDWYSFTSFGANVTTTHNGTKNGNEYLYQGGIGRNIASVPSEWIFSALIEIDGQYAVKNRINGNTDPNSGGNIILLTPSLWLSFKQLSFQLGMGFPVVQNLFGQQEKNHYLAASGFTWTVS